MSDLSDEELARAGHVRRLRTGNATSESYRRRRQRETRSGSEADAEDAEDAEDGDEGEQTPNAEDEADGSEPEDRPLAPGTLLAEIEDRPDLDAVELPEDAPEDLHVLAVPVREELRREFNRVAESLGMRYGFAYERDLDPEHHARPLALYLGMRQLEDADPEKVQAFLERIDDLEAP